MYIPRDWEFGSAWQNFGISGGLNPSFGTPLVNRERVIKLRGRTAIPVISKGDGQQFKHEQTELNNNASI
jgi:hypothetical protein